MNREEGFTLVELLITTAITGLIVSFLGVAIHQVVTVTDYGNSKMVALHELQNVAHLLSIDGQEASSASGGDELTLGLPDSSLVTYALVGTVLERTKGESQMTLAQNISDLSFSVEGQVISMSITSAPEGSQDASQQATYKVYLRTTPEEQ